MTGKVTKLALWSRVIVLIFQFIANATLPDHKPDVFRSPLPLKSLFLSESSTATTSTISADAASSLTWLDKTLNYCFGGLRHWDGEYFLHIAEHAYSYENTLAFYPLYPAVIHSLGKLLNYSYDGTILDLRSAFLITAIAINIFCFCKAANVLYALTQRIFNDPNKSWNAVLLFCFNPASIFFTASYSESLYCWLSFVLMLECVTEMRFHQITLKLALTMICRSNGFINIGYPVYFYIRKALVKSGQGLLTAIYKIILCIMFALLPLQFFYFYAFQQFCLPYDKGIHHTRAVMSYARERHYILAGPRQGQNSPWCDKTIPIPYSYVQSHYWNVGFLNYYQFKQLPNFVLAAPILIFLFYQCYKYLRYLVMLILPKITLLQMLKEYKSLPFVVHALFLTIVCTCFVHIQVSTRLICSATPCIYWFAADFLPRTFDQVKMRSKAGAIIMWFGSYYLVGTLLFSNNLPWT